MLKKLSSVENFCLFEHMIACVKAFENVAIKQNITTGGMLLASASFDSELHSFVSSNQAKMLMNLL